MEIDLNELLWTALRATFVYLFLLVIVRLLGKREIGSTSAFDLVVALILGEVVDEIIYGDVTVLQGVVAIVVVAAWHVANSWASFKSEFIDKLTGAPPTVVVKNGQIQRKNLAKERLNESELFSELRLMGVEDVKEVKQATLEPNGQISVIQEEWAKPVQRQDILDVKPRNSRKKS
ncbi:MAG TPA: YetF domain-containing protein [Anaerolineales bacterium]|nr:YetF domain-containing protein [Anaerolineales bacterium]